MSEKIRLHDDQEFFSYAEETLQMIAKKRPEAGVSQRDLELLNTAERIIRDVIERIQTENIPGNQAHRRAIFAEATYIINDERALGDLGSRVLRLESYFAIHEPVRESVRLTLG